MTANEPATNFYSTCKLAKSYFHLIYANTHAGKFFLGEHQPHNLVLKKVTIWFITNASKPADVPVKQGQK